MTCVMRSVPAGTERDVPQGRTEFNARTQRPVDVSEELECIAGRWEVADGISFS